MIVYVQLPGGLIILEDDLRALASVLHCIMEEEPRFLDGSFHECMSSEIPK